MGGVGVSLREPREFEKVQVELRSFAMDHFGNYFTNNSRKLKSMSRTRAGDDHLRKFRVIIENEMLIGRVGVLTYSR